MSSEESSPTASIETLKRRAKLLIALRNFFESSGYWEVQTPILSQDCCVDAWIDPFNVALPNNELRYLQTSPEFAMKRLLCHGADRIYEVARVFRQEEQGSRHNSEFTMVEWYACHCDHQTQMDFVEKLVAHLFERCRLEGWSDRESIEIQRLAYDEAFLRFAGVSALTGSMSELIQAAHRTTGRLPVGIETDRDGLLNLILTDQIEPALAKMGAVFLYDFPASQAALAVIRDDGPPVAERFELYLDGIELCNGYHELCDPVEQAARMAMQNEKRVANGKPAIPENSRLTQLMENRALPPSSGVALGFDRLVMACLGLRDIQDVMAFPFDRA